MEVGVQGLDPQPGEGAAVETTLPVGLSAGGSVPHAWFSTVAPELYVIPECT